jgi:predicted small lipoprotein YifL
MANASLRHIALACLVLALPGCGKKGPLYLPEEPGEVVTRPAEAPPSQESGEAPNSPKTIDSEPKAPAPAPEVAPPEDPEKDSRKDKGATPPQQK